jgi:uncharacterized peroxidase-related enzyme
MRIQPVPADHASELFERAERLYRFLPNTIRVMARGTRVGELYLEAGRLNRRATLSALERELLAITTAAYNRCEYCLAAHTLAAQAFGASPDQAAAAQDAQAEDPRTAALLEYALAVLEARGRISDGQLAAARAAGLDDTTLLDVLAVVVENTLGNFVNNLALTDVDESLRGRSLTSAGSS